ncbi:unnamed protein product [Caenorhabditis nigoni]
MLPSAGHYSQQAYQQPNGQYSTGQIPMQAAMQPSSNTGNSQEVNTAIVPGNGGSQQILVDKSELEKLREELRDSKIRIAVLESTERYHRAKRINEKLVAPNVNTVETNTATQASTLPENMVENSVSTTRLAEPLALETTTKSQEPVLKDIKPIEPPAPLSYASVAKKCFDATALPQPPLPKPQLTMTKVPIKMDLVPKSPRSPGRKPVSTDKSTSCSATKSSFEDTHISKENRNDDSGFMEVKRKSRGSTAQLAPLSGNTNWVDRDQVYKKWNKEARQESSKNTAAPTVDVSEKKSAKEMEKEAKYDVLCLEVELVQTPFKPKKPKNKKKNKNKKNKKESSMETENGDFEIPNDVAEKKTVDEEAKNKKPKEILFNRHQKMELLKSYKETIASYSKTMRTLRCFHLGFKKERPLLHPFQMVILDHLETSSPFNLTGRRAEIEAKVVERTKAYNKEFKSDSDQIGVFVTAICNRSFAEDSVINADLLFLYENELEEGLLRDREKNYFDMVVNFIQWTPNNTGQHPVLMEDLRRIPVSLETTHIKSFSYHVYIQTMARVNNDNTSFKAYVMNGLDQEIMKAYKVFENEKLSWTLGESQAFLKSRLEYHKSLPKDAVSEKNVKFFEFLLNVTSNVLNFDVFWFYHVPPMSASLDDASLDGMFIQHLFYQFS